MKISSSQVNLRGAPASVMAIEVVVESVDLLPTRAKYEVPSNPKGKEDPLKWVVSPT